MHSNCRNLGAQSMYMYVCVGVYVPARKFTWISTAECVRASLSIISTLDVGTTPGS